ncbi:MAG: GNAT family N-acetyltransferase [Pseudomonadota bacterium]
MSVTLFDPAVEAPPNPSDKASNYLHSLASIGLGKLIPNVRTKLLGLRAGDRVLPVTVNDGAIGASYVSEPYSAYILYARREIELVGAGLEKWLFLPLIGIAALLLRLARINRIVHLDNWLLSTNLHGDWEGEDLADIRRLILDRFPDHILAIRSLDPWSSPRLLDCAVEDGWDLMPSRQIWVTSDMNAQWKPRHSVAEDRRVLRKSGLQVETLTAITREDAERIEELYAMLYLEKYSQLNPAFSADWIMETCRLGVIQYCCARDNKGVIQAISGTLQRGDVITAPVVGYDTTKPQSLGLYRIASLLFSEEAHEQGLRLNGSAGAASFKRYRGAQPEIEYSAFFTAHLPFVRRVILKGISSLLTRIAVPYMRKHKL